MFDEKGVLTRPVDRTAFLDEVAASGVRTCSCSATGGALRSRPPAASTRRCSRSSAPPPAPCRHSGRSGSPGIFWPSLWFPDTPATPPRRPGSTQAGTGGVVAESAGTAALSGAEIAASLRPGFTDPAQQETVGTDRGAHRRGRGRSGPRRARRGQGKAARGAEPPWSARWYRLNRSIPFEDAGETALLLTSDPKRDYQAAAEVFGSAPPGSSTQGLGDWFDKAVNGAKDAVRVLSYNVMKARAGDIGRSGLGPLLADLHRRSPQLRVHLVGHSFGARLVSFAARRGRRPADSPIASLVLMQGAFSHWSFAGAHQNPFGRSGALNGFADRVHGPLVATFSPVRLGGLPLVSEGIVPRSAGRRGRGRGSLGRHGRRRVPGGQCRA